MKRCMKTSYNQPTSTAYHTATVNETIGANAQTYRDDGEDGVALDETQPDKGGGRKQDASTVKDLPRNTDRNLSRTDELVGEVTDWQCHDSKSCVGQGSGDAILHTKK